MFRCEHRKQFAWCQAESFRQSDVVNDSSVELTFLDFPEVCSVNTSLIGQFLQPQVAFQSERADVSAQVNEILNFLGSELLWLAPSGHVVSLPDTL